MDDIPKLRKRSNRKPINILLDQDVDELYRTGKGNGWDTAEIARQAVQKELRSISSKLKKSAG